MAQAELNLRIAAPLLERVRERHGAKALEEIASEADVPLETLRSVDAWVTHEALERVLEAVRVRLGSDEDLAEACGSGAGRGEGWLEHLLGAIGVRDVYELCARELRATSRGSRVDVRREPSGAVIVRYASDVPESRLLCLLQQGRLKHRLRHLGLPAAHLEETRCMASGDDCCEYRLTVQERHRWWPALVGLVVGAVGAAALGSLELRGLALVSVVALVGAGVGFLLELRRTTRVNALAARESAEAHLGTMRAEAEARRELLDLTARQHEWIRRLEERRDDDSTVEQLARGIEAVRERWIASIRGFSHDVRSPLTVVKTNVGYLRDSGAVVDDEGGAVLDDIDAGVQQIERLLNDLLRVATFDLGNVRLEPETVETATLAERIRARAAALVRGRPVRVSVTRTREAPASIECDRLLLDRVLDNLLSSAAKYTDRGSIAVEVDGTPGVLTLKISDTGRGVNEAELERVFQRGARRSKATGDVWGVGLPTVVQLLGRIGGRLEVMSKPGTGTTFWAHVPITLPPSSAAEAEAVSNVVSIRRARSA